MKKLLIVGAVATLLSCVSPSAAPLYSVDQQLRPSQRYLAEFDWQEFASAADKDVDAKVNCVFHAFEFSLDDHGKITDLDLIDSSHDFASELSAAAARKWQFEPAGDLKKGRLAFVYRKFDKPLHYLFPLDMNVRGPAALRSERLASEQGKLKLVPLKRISPKYPQTLALRGVSGSAVIAFDVLADGSTANLEIIGSWPDPRFGTASRKAVEKWRYQAPGKTVGETVRMDFRLGSGPTAFFKGSCSVHISLLPNTFPKLVCEALL